MTDDNSDGIEPFTEGLTFSSAIDKNHPLHGPEHQDLTTVTLPIVPAVGPLCTLTEDGERLHRRIEALLNEGYSITLDFRGVRLVTKTFYTAVVGNLEYRYPGVRLTSVNLPAESPFPLMCGLTFGGSQQCTLTQFWTDQHGEKWEMKTENGKGYYRRPGETDDKWKEGMPPCWKIVRPSSRA